MNTGLTTLVSASPTSTPAAPVAGNSYAQSAQISGDGSAILFADSATNLTTGIIYQGNAATQLFRADLAAGTVDLVDTETSAATTGNAASTTGSQSVSADGRYEASAATPPTWSPA